MNTQLGAMIRLEYGNQAFQHPSPLSKRQLGAVISWPVAQPPRPHSPAPNNSQPHTVSQPLPLNGQPRTMAASKASARHHEA
jgi:hypothetical protein